MGRLHAALMIGNLVHFFLTWISLPAVTMALLKSLQQRHPDRLDDLDVNVTSSPSLNSVSLYGSAIASRMHQKPRPWVVTPKIWGHNTDHNHIQACYFVLACYTVSPTTGETLLCKKFQYDALLGCIRIMIKCHTHRHLLSPHKSTTWGPSLMLFANTRRYQASMRWFTKQCMNSFQSYTALNPFSRNWKFANFTKSPNPKSTKLGRLG